MSGMFRSCSSLKELDISGFDTSNVTAMDQMFSGCSSLESLDLSHFDTSKTVLMGGMFMDCSSLRSVDVTGFDTSNVMIMSAMFYGCRSLESLDLSGFDTSNATEMIYMFKDCVSLKQLDISGFDTQSVFEQADWTQDVFSCLNNMFSCCALLESISLGEAFSLYSDTGLPGGIWCNGSLEYSVEKLYKKWDASLSGTWTREVSPVAYTVFKLADQTKIRSLSQ